MKPDKKNTIFFLGGYDLEMLEIKKLLLAEKFKVLDTKLSWENAWLSKYARFFNKTKRFVGIELREDIKPPLHYQLIDHHNENSDIPSAIEQVADLIGVKLTREQQLIAANDKGYIPAMKALGATDDEISDIRRRDRAAQGVTEEDEKLGEKSIEENIIIDHDLIQVKSLTPHFSTITDRLYPFKELLIKYNNEIVYHGNKSTKLANEFLNLIIDKKAFTGGGENGYFGIDPNKVSEFESVRIYKEILKNLLV